MHDLESWMLHPDVLGEMTSAYIHSRALSVELYHLEEGGEVFMLAEEWEMAPGREGAGEPKAD